MTFQSLYISEDLDKEKLMVSVRNRDVDEDEASSPGCMPSLLQRDLSALEKSRLRNAYKMGFTRDTEKRIKSTVINTSSGIASICSPGRRIKNPVT